MRRIHSSFVAALVGLAVAGSAFTANAQSEAPASEISFASVALNVADIPRAEKFYSEVFGLVRTFQFPPAGEPIEIGPAARPAGRHGPSAGALQRRSAPRGQVSLWPDHHHDE